MPGVTKAQQWIKVGKEIELLDTPGILWPKFEDPETGFKLALTGAIKDALLEMQELAIYGLRFLEREYPHRLQERYGLERLDEDIVHAFDHIGRKRNILEGGGDVDYEATADAIVRDIRNGQLGRLTFDRTADIGRD